MFPYGVGKVVQSIFIKVFAGLVESRFYLSDGEIDRTALLRLKGGVTQQRAEAFAQAAF